MSLSREEWRAKLDALPEPMTGSPPWENVQHGGKEGEDAYQLASEYTAKAMLIMADENPSLLDFPEGMTDSWDKAMYGATWEAAKERWPGLDDWLGGISGNMFGWANQLVRWIKEAEQVGNPAIVTIRMKEPGE